MYGACGRLDRMKYLIIIILLFPFTVQAWDKQEIALEVIWQTLHAVDWLQTQEIASNDDYYETNLLIGKYPSRGRVNTHMALFAVGHVAISHFMPDKYRKYWQGISIVVKGGYVVHNYSIGIRF